MRLTVFPEAEAETFKVLNRFFNSGSTCIPDISNKINILLSLQTYRFVLMLGSFIIRFH